MEKYSTVEQLAGLMKGLEIPASGAVMSPEQLEFLGGAIANQAKPSTTHVLISRECAKYASAVIDTYTEHQTFSGDRQEKVDGFKAELQQALKGDE